jgi:copper chaperone CopZ
VSVAVKKVHGVQKVDVSLNKGNATIEFKPESTAQYDDVRSGIEKNGFVIRDAQITARGKLQRTNGMLQFVVSGSGETFNVSVQNSNAEVAHTLETRVGQDVALDATVPAPEKNKRQDKLLVKSIRK